MSALLRNVRVSLSKSVWRCGKARLSGMSAISTRSCALFLCVWLGDFRMMYSYRYILLGSHFDNDFVIDDLRPHCWDRSIPWHQFRTPVTFPPFPPTSHLLHYSHPSSRQSAKPHPFLVDEIVQLSLGGEWWRLSSSDGSPMLLRSEEREDLKGFWSIK